MKKITLIMFLCLGLLVGTTAFGAGKVIVIRFAHSSPANALEQCTSAEAAVFTSEMDKITSGKVNVKVYPDSSLGDHNAALQQVKRGTLEMANIASGVLASAFYEPLSVFDIPYLITANAVGWKLTRLDNPFMKKMVEEVRQKTGLRIVGIQPEGFRHFTNNKRPIRNPKDLKGLKIRTMKVKPHLEMVKALGAMPTAISFAELYTALQTGVVDGEENTIQNMLASHFDEVQKYLTLDGHVFLLGITIVNDKWFTGLPKDIQNKIYEAEEVACVAATGLSHIKEATGIAELQKRGMQIYSPTAAELNMFKKATQKPVIDYLLSRKVDRSYIDGIANEIKKLERKSE
jgi:tripartite ATP-independent transporter DctP family solute receptor